MTEQREHVHGNAGIWRRFRIGPLWAVWSVGPRSRFFDLGGKEWSASFRNGRLWTFHFYSHVWDNHREGHWRHWRMRVLRRVGRKNIYGF